MGCVDYIGKSILIVEPCKGIFLVYLSINRVMITKATRVNATICMKGIVFPQNAA